jgi:hypothetical protein
MSLLQFDHMNVEAHEAVLTAKSTALVIVDLCDEKLGSLLKEDLTFTLVGRTRKLANVLPGPQPSTRPPGTGGRSAPNVAISECPDPTSTIPP